MQKQQNVSLGEYMCLWLDCKRPSLAPSTEVEYARILSKYIMASPVGAEKLNSLSPVSLMRVLSVPLGLRYTRQAQILAMLLREALRDGCRCGLCSDSLTAFLVVPKHTPREVRPWNLGEVKQFLTSEQGSSLYAVWLLALCLGLRRGELLGLRWSDIDFQHQILHVRNQRIRISGRIIDKPPKSRAGIRDLYVPDAVLASLRALRASEGVSGVYVCPLSPESLAKELSRAQDRACVRRLNLHGLRHTMATVSISAGTNPKTLQGILGHSRYQTTANLYCHKDLNEERKALEALSAIL